MHRLGHRRPAADREHARRIPRPRPAQDLAVLRAGLDHQHGRGPRVDPLRLSRPEPRDRERVLDGEPQPGRGRAPDRIRRRRHHGGGRRRVDGEPARRRRLLRGARAVDAQRRPGDGVATVGSRARRFRAGRGRRCAGARGAGTREGARREDLLRARGVRDERGRASHHGAAGRRAGRGPQHAQCAAQRRDERRRGRLHQCSRHVDAAGRRRGVRRGQSRVRRSREESSR